MPSFRSEIVLGVSPVVAWQFIEERGREIERFRFEPQGKQAPGVINHIVMRVLGMPVRAQSRTVTWDPPTVCAFESVKPARPVTTKITESFRPIDVGTQHVIEYEVAGSGPVGRIVAPTFCRIMRRDRRRYQERLRDALAL